MDEQFAANIIKIIVFLPFVLLLAYISLKIGGSHLIKMGNGRIIRLIERVPLSNKTCLYVVSINGKPYVIGVSEEKFEVLMELPAEVLENIKQDKSGFMLNAIKNLDSFIKRKDKL
ncbi:MAG TPA: flagellar biosynthesis protein FliZ [Clostridiaceae bacterium]|jgi:flagellar protein FliO/FliZ|nr:flagellar biosynthesis protein FliZ [Clostridiaceae bacterium]